MFDEKVFIGHFAGLVKMNGPEYLPSEKAKPH